MFRFSIRDVLWLTVVVALLCLLWQTRTERARLLEAERKRAAAQEQAALLNLALGWKDRFYLQRQQQRESASSPDRTSD